MRVLTEIVNKIAVEASATNLGIQMVQRYDGIYREAFSVNNDHVSRARGRRLGLVTYGADTKLVVAAQASCCDCSVK
jgi:hypothetical protein